MRERSFGFRDFYGVGEVGIMWVCVSMWERGRVACGGRGFIG